MNTQRKTVAVLGNGVVGVSIAKGFAKLDYPIIFGTRDISGAKTKEALAAVPGAKASSSIEAVKAADLAIVALPWAGLVEGLKSAGTENFAGKMVIDITNPLDFSDGVPRLLIGHTDSAGETVQRLLPTAKVVKAFNIIAAAHMVDPKLTDGEPDMFIAGNDDEAKSETTALLHKFGWRSVIDMGGIEAARLLESLALMWIRYGFIHNHWTHGFSLLGKK